MFRFGVIDNENAATGGPLNRIGVAEIEGLRKNASYIQICMSTTSGRFGEEKSTKFLKTDVFCENLE